MSSEIDQALQNLAAIKNEDSVNEEPQHETPDALAAAIEEVDRLYKDFPVIEQHIPRSMMHVVTARWERKNGTWKGKRKPKKQVYNKRLTGLEHATGHHLVAVNERIYEQGNVEDFIDTVRHEVAHAVVYEMNGKESQGHNHKWKAMATKLGADPSSSHKKKTDTYKYYIACPNGCYSPNGKRRRSKRIKKPWRYTCNTCGTQCVSFDEGDDVPSAPGTCTVESIPWYNFAEYLHKS